LPRGRRPSTLGASDHDRQGMVVVRAEPYRPSPMTPDPRNPPMSVPSIPAIASSGAPPRRRPSTPSSAWTFPDWPGAEVSSDEGSVLLEPPPGGHALADRAGPRVDSLVGSEAIDRTRRHGVARRGDSRRGREGRDLRRPMVRRGHVRGRRGLPAQRLLRAPLVRGALRSAPTPLLVRDRAARRRVRRESSRPSHRTRRSSRAGERASRRSRTPSTGRCATGSTS
jgi:hypothetical protein